MSLLVRAFPLKATREDLANFISTVQGRKPEVEDFYQAHGVTHESWYLQETGQGPWVIGLTQVEDVRQSAPQFQAAQSGFARWFKDQIRELSGVDPDAAPLGPPTDLVYEWSDCEATAQAFCAPPRI